MTDLGYIALLLSVGSFFAVHCSRATMREWGAGRALGGRWGDHERDTPSIAFWLIMTGNALAAIMGGVFLLLGLVYLLADLGCIK